MWKSFFFSSFTFQFFLFPFPLIRRQHGVNHWLLRDLISLANRFREPVYPFINYHLPLSTRNLELFLAPPYSIILCLHRRKQHHHHHILSATDQSAPPHLLLGPPTSFLLCHFALSLSLFLQRKVNPPLVIYYYYYYCSLFFIFFFFILFRHSPLSTLIFLLLSTS